MNLEPGMTIGRFTIDEVVDRGSTGDVYKAFDEKRQEHVAIQVPSKTGYFALRRFSRETKPLLQIRHANIASVYETATLKGVPILVAEFVEGKTIDDHLAAHHDSTTEILELIAQVADGLQAAHKVGVIHRDLKPSNILVTSEHEAKICDFGMGSLVKELSPYAAPEVFHGKKIDASADIFALGALSYELLTGRPGIATTVLESSPDLRGVSYEMRTVLERMLKKDPEARPKAEDVARALRGAPVIVLGRSSAPPERYQLQFSDAESMNAALAAEGKALQPVVSSSMYHFVAIEVESREEMRIIEDLERHYGAKLVKDKRYSLEFDPENPECWAEESAAKADLDDVLHYIKADQTRHATRGENVTIAIVDSGIAGSRAEFSRARRFGQWQSKGDDAWRDENGHGTMVATIAAASRSDGGEFEGVAPASRIISCKITKSIEGVTESFDSNAAAAFAYLRNLALTQPEMRIVATCCWGSRTGSPPKIDPTDIFPRALADAIEAGVFVVCSAGNYHQLAKGAADACSPCSIWLHKSRADLLTVGTCSLDGKMWFYSSRGPGQDHGEENTNHKPDVVAPTPKDGRILYGTRKRTGLYGWGTSGAAPQVAGLVALLLSADPGIPRARLQAMIRDTADLEWQKACCGAGMIDCAAALNALSDGSRSV